MFDQFKSYLSGVRADSSYLDKARELEDLILGWEPPEGVGSPLNWDILGVGFHSELAPGVDLRMVVWTENPTIIAELTVNESQEGLPHGYMANMALGALMEKVEFLVCELLDEDVERVEAEHLNTAILGDGEYETLYISKYTVRTTSML